MPRESELGAAPERVMLVRADLGDAVAIGSGTAIGHGRVLTAAHVVFDDDGAPLPSVRAGPPEYPRLASVRVVWPSRYVPSDGRSDVDVAVLEVTDGDVRIGAVGPARYGRLTGRSPVEAAAIGFPRVLRDPDGTRDSDHMTGRIAPGSRRVTGRYDISVTSAVPKVPTSARAPSPWSGMSGAGVWAGGRLIGVVVIDTPEFPANRLSAVPVVRLAAETELAGLLDDGGPRVVSVELRELFHESSDPVERRRRGRRSPAGLLRADAEAVPFEGRREILDDLLAWCADPAELAVRLITGPGGQGKTRLARQLLSELGCDRPVPERPQPPYTGDAVGHRQPLDQRNGGVVDDETPGADPAIAVWTGGFLRADPPDAGLELDRLADTADPVVVVVDYAETRTAQLRRLLEVVWSSDAAPARLVLLARGAGDWWHQLQRDLDDAIGPVVPLAPLVDRADRESSFEAAVTALAARLLSLDPETDWPAVTGHVATPPDLSEPKYGNPLTLQLAALIGLLQNGPDPVADQERPEDTLLRHEQRYWDASAADAQVALHEATLQDAVAAAALFGARSPDQATDLLRALPFLGDQTLDTIRRVDTWLATVYAPDAGHRWGSLQPDRIAEHLVATVLAANPQLLAQTTRVASGEQARQALTVIARALANPSIGGPTQSQLEHQISDALAAQLDALAPIALDVITRTTNPAPLLGAVEQAARHATPAQLVTLTNAFPDVSMTLTPLAATLTGRVVDTNRQLAAASPDAYLPHLATSLNNLSVRLGDLGRREDALAAIDEAVTTHRQLAAARPDAYLPHLATSLNNLSNHLSDVGRREDALAAIDEAVTIRRQLAAARPDAYLPHLATSLNNLSNGLSGVGRREDALAAIDEAVTIRRQLAAARPDAYLPHLATSLNNLSNHLSDLGLPEDALAAVDEAVTIRRQLAAARPDAFLPELAMALNNLSNHLGSLGRREDALVAIDEAVTELLPRLERRPYLLPDAGLRIVQRYIEVAGELGIEPDGEVIARFAAVLRSGGIISDE